MNRMRFLVGGILVTFALVVAYTLTNAQSLSDPVTIRLMEENNSEQSGTATLTDVGGGKTKIDIEVTGQPAETSQPMQVHAGQCGPSLARLAYPLSNLEGGKSTTTIDASFNTLFTGNFAINGHKSAEEYNIYVLCGNIPAAAAYIEQATATAAAALAMQATTPEIHPPITVPLMAENSSGLTGTATLTDLGNGQTKIEFDVAGQTPDSSHIMHLHVGQCGPTLGRLVFRLNDLENGKSTTTIDAPIGSLTTGNYALNGHKSEEEYNIYVLCGNIPAEGAVPVATPASQAATATPPAVQATAAVVAPTEAAAATSEPPTAVPPTATSAPATATSVPPTATSIRATATSAPATATSAPATATSVPATATSAPATATSVPPTATSVRATATSAPATATSVPATATTAATSSAAGPTETTAEATSQATAAATAAVTTEVTAEATSEATAAATAEATGAAGSSTQTAPTTTAAETTTPAGAAGTTETPGPTASVAAPTTAPAKPTPGTIPESGANPSTNWFLYTVILGVLVMGAGLGLLQWSDRGELR